MLLNLTSNIWFAHTSKKYVSLLVFLCCNLVNAQTFKKVDSIALSYAYDIKTPNALADRISNDFNTDVNKVRALYIYLTHSITYNLNEYNYGATDYSFRYKSKKELEAKLRKRNLEIIEKTLREKTAICEGYSMVFHEVCTILAIKSHIISGFTRSPNSKIGSLPLSGKHAWNAVYIEDKWKFIDTTWGSGYTLDYDHWIQSYDEYYFFPSPNDLLTTHFPEDASWQLVKIPLTEQEFANQPIYSALFFRKRIGLVSPKSGTVTANKDGEILIQLNNVKRDAEIGYAFEKDYYLTTIIPEFKNKKATIKIPILGKQNTILNILLDTEMILQFKIN